MNIRPLRPGEEILWARCAPAGEYERRLAALQTKSPLFPAEEPRCQLVAEEDRHFLGTLRLGLPHEGLCLVIELTAADEVPLGEVAPALLDFVRSSFPDRTLEALTWDRPADAEFHKALLECGFEVYIEKEYVNRDLAGFQLNVADPFVWRTLEEAGKAAFAEALYVLRAL